MQHEKCVSTVSELEKTIKTYGTEREGKLKALEKRIKSIKSEMQSMSKQLKVVYFLILATIPGVFYCLIYEEFSINDFFLVMDMLIYGNSCGRILDVDPGPSWYDLGVMIDYCTGYAGIKEIGANGQSDCLNAKYC